MNYHNIFTPAQHLRRPPVNSGGLCWLVFTKWEDVELWPKVDPLSGLCNTPIALKPGCTWYEGKFVDKGRMFQEEMSVGPAGPFWEMSITGYLGGNTTSHTLAAGTLQYHQYVVMWQDRDGQVRFMGNSDSGADIKNVYTSGDSEASRKRTVTWSWEHTLPAQIYVGSLADINDDMITPPFAGLGDFNDDFSDDFSNE